MIEDRVTAALRQAVASRGNPFQTYQEFARQYGFSDKFCLSWANRPALNKVADALKSDPSIGIDLTFLIRNSTTNYPSVIDAVAFDRKNKERQNAQKKRAREVADQIITKFGLRAQNPY